ncbi:hypothetical protein D6T64_20680 [Cryobacterium melibiosiphilum]|uniref:Lipoprotein n=1 Tax=Cryobacterium melibiosiphilum TaxID=995039 RepID=A0A3A5MHF7_9MICO|nr:hypothetical protein [Cryobacterium melibiosiphilum]RJT84821.1 hypothetical protein D6T64_20680 [Cryobacterium melibiosiphilum]
MNRRLIALVAVPFLFLLVGCSQVQDAATEAASDAASQAAAAAADAVQQEVCRVAADGQISEQDQQTLAGLLVGAEAAGVPAEFVAPLKDIAEAGDQLPVDALTALSAECDAAGTATPAG